MGLFIVFEGIDGSGKTSLVKRIHEKIEHYGLKVDATFEPGATPFGHEIRILLLDKYTDLDPITELLLFEADRRYHYKSNIKYLLDEDYIVLCDRYTLSSIVYQGYASNYPMSIVRELNDLATDGCEPDFTVVVDTPVDIAIPRTGYDNITAKDLSFFERVREGFVNCCPQPDSLIIDGTQTEDEVFEEAWEAIELLILLKGYFDVEDPKI